MRLTLTLLLIFSFSFLFAQEVIYQGSFEAESRWTTFEGDWKIEKDWESYYVVFAGNFEAKKAPDLKIFISKMAFDEISGKNATQQAVLVAKLNAYQGKMRFVIPSSIDPRDFQSIIVHCEEYAKLWGGSSLR